MSSVPHTPEMHAYLRELMKPMFIGFVGNLCLETLVIYLTANVYQKYQRYKCRDLICVSIGFLFSIIQSSIVAFKLFHDFVLNFGEYEAWNHMGWVVWLSPFLLATIGVSVQVFYAIRVWHLLGNPSWFPLVVGPLIVWVLIGGYSTGAVLFHTQVTWINAQASVLPPLLFSSLACHAIADTLISGVMIIRLWQSRTGFDHTDHAITRIVRTSMETCLMTTLDALLLIGLYAWAGSKPTAIHTAYTPAYYTLPPLYMLSMLVTLASREQMWKRGPRMSTANVRSRSQIASLESQVSSLPPSPSTPTFKSAPREQTHKLVVIDKSQLTPSLGPSILVTEERFSVHDKYFDV